VRIAFLLVSLSLLVSCCSAPTGLPDGSSMDPLRLGGCDSCRIIFTP